MLPEVISFEVKIQELFPTGVIGVAALLLAGMEPVKEQELVQITTVSAPCLKHSLVVEITLAMSAHLLIHMRIWVEAIAVQRTENTTERGSIKDIAMVVLLVIPVIVAKTMTFLHVQALPAFKHVSFFIFNFFIICNFLIFNFFN